MTLCEKFDLVNNRLQGTNLIEASAGTGKTYTIAGLYLRLVVEEKIPVEKILVVTFTEAATQELKERIRLRLKEAVSAFEMGKSEDLLLAELLQSSGDCKEALESTKDALRTFDQAAVYTIHGFCQRMLVENAFESGSLFETELVGSSNELVEEIMKDFWRKEMYETTSLFAGFLKHRKIQPLTFASFVTACLKPGIIVKPSATHQNPAESEKRFSGSYAEASSLWKSEKQNIEEIMTDDPWLNRKRFGKKSIPGWLETIDDYFTGDSSEFPVPDCLIKFTSDYLAEPGSIKKNGIVPENSFFNGCSELLVTYQQLEEAYNLNLLWYKTAAADYVKSQLEIRKQERGILGFDDLLANLHKGLTGENGTHLAANIRQKYSVALIDEFQDTDPIQYEIFFDIFGGDESSLFMIGDPKQAIYGFRGADIFAYMNASKDADAAYTLAYNYRSEPEIIDAVNTLFSHRENPFVFNRIEFSPVNAAEIDNRAICVIDDDNSFFNILQLLSGDKPLTKTVAADIAPQAVASEITHLLKLSEQGVARIGERSIKEQDIAVLVRTNSEAENMKALLNQSGVPAVIYSTGNVFDSPEALELERILSAVLFPANEGLVKAALVTDMFGYKGGNFADFQEKPENFESIKDSFREYHDLWVNYGFIRMFNALMENEDILVRLMAFADGERRNTNFLHLSQLLQQTSMEKKYGPERLLKWFSLQRESIDAGNEEHQLRLESDSDSVRIITIHKSKGMEYPIVFCPYIWSGKASHLKPEFQIFHDRNADMALTLDAGSEDYDESEEIAKTESLAEDLRLLYVALTRAKSRCYILWGRVKGSENTAFAHLVHGTGSDKTKIPDTDADVNTDLETVAKKAHGTIKIKPVPSEPVEKRLKQQIENQVLERRKFNTPIESDYKIASFTSLTSQIHKSYNGEDRDAFTLEKPEREKSKCTDIFAFPKGASPGTFMHSVFEDLDFKTDKETKENLIEEKLSDYGFDQKWKDSILEMVDNVLSKPLDKENSGFKLGNITNEDRINELEFYFPLKPVSSGQLNALLQKHESECFFKTENLTDHSWKLEFSPVKGFMKGFIDLIFRVNKEGDDRYYIVDWKSNWLGSSIEDYHPENLSAVMLEEYYVLQYLLYSVALNRYLMLRLGDSYDYDKHFGGAYYIFLRGVTPDLSNDFGVFFNKPSKEFISDLSFLILEGL